MAPITMAAMIPVMVMVSSFGSDSGDGSEQVARPAMMGNMDSDNAVLLLVRKAWETGGTMVPQRMSLRAK